MKKQKRSLYRSIKQIIRENKKGLLGKKVLTEQKSDTPSFDPTSPLQKLRTQPDLLIALANSLSTSIDKLPTVIKDRPEKVLQAAEDLGIEGFEINDYEFIDPNPIGNLGGFIAPGYSGTIPTECDANPNYGTLTLYAGNCDQGQNNVITDGFICCASENSDNVEGNYEFMDSDWGPWSVLDGLEIVGGDEDPCYCAVPNVNANGELIDCGMPGGFTLADIDAWLLGLGGAGTVASNSVFNGDNGETASETGDNCVGCFHTDATNHNFRTYTTNTLTGGTQPDVLGCSGATGDITQANKDDISCCDFTLTCATDTVTGYHDGNTVWPGGIFDNTNGTVVSLSSTNLTAFTTQGTSIAANASNSWLNANITDSGGCTFTGCANDSSVATVATNYTTVVYGVDANGAAVMVTGAPTITGNSPACIDSQYGCTDAAACNHNPGANIDDGTCDYTSCVGCMDDGSGGNDTNGVALAGSNMPSGWVGAACNYQDGETDATNFPYNISDNSACNYTDCVECTDTNACDYPAAPNSYANMGTVSNAAVCDYSCYGCGPGVELEGFTGNGINAVTAYNQSYTINNYLDNQNVPFDPAISPCQVKGCIAPTDTTSGIAHTNYLCNQNPTYKLCEDAGTGAPCGGPCPGGVYKQSLVASNPAGWTDCNGLTNGPDTSCCQTGIMGGCTEPGACNIDLTANADCAGVVGGSDHTCCDTPGECEVCHPNYPNTLFDNDPACACKDITAYKCNREQETRIFQCMTINSQDPVIGQEFKVLKKIAMAKESIFADGASLMEQAAVSGYNLVEPSQTLQNKQASNVNTQVWIVDTVFNSYGPIVKNYQPATCTETNYGCWCVNGQRFSGGTGWTGHPHYCKSTQEPTNPHNIWDNIYDCQANCGGSQGVSPTVHFDQQGNSDIEKWIKGDVKSTDRPSPSDEPSMGKFDPLNIPNPEIPNVDIPNVDVDVPNEDPIKESKILRKNLEKSFKLSKNSNEKIRSIIKEVIKKSIKK